VRTTWLLIVIAGACGGKDDDGGGGDGDPAGACAVSDDEACPAGQVCEPVEGGEPACFAPLTVEGQVRDAATDDGIEGARIVARNVNGAARSRVAVSDVDGTYSLVVSSLRDAEGRPIGEPFTLRADAAGYQSFPTAPRTALPIEPDSADDDGVLVSAATDITLLSLPSTAGLGAIAGQVDADDPGGALVVAGGATAIADLDGSFVVFGVPAGNTEVRGYLAGVNLAPATADVSEGETTDGIVLAGRGAADAVVSGDVQIVNAPGGASTQVILVVEDTFDPVSLRGETPGGLRAGNVDGAWQIEGVPDGRYAVLAAFENDDLVRDPDTSIGGTDIVTIEVAGADTAVEGFKVTEALEVFSPGADGIEAVSAPVTLSWADDSSEDGYDVEVLDAFGEVVWQATDVEGPNGNRPVEVAYDGPLEPGMIYQFHATSMKDGVPLSTTEDLRGVFQAQ